MSKLHTESSLMDTNVNTSQLKSTILKEIATPLS